MEEVKNILVRRVPIVAIRDSVVFPHTDAVLSFGRKKSISAVNAAFQEDKIVAIFTQKDSRTPEPKEEDLYKVGTIVTITQMMSDENEVHAVVRGQVRVVLKSIVAYEPYLVAEVAEIPDRVTEIEQVEALANKLSDVFKKSINLGKQAEITTVIRLVSGKVEPVELVDQVASILDVRTSEKQKLLETVSVSERLEKVLLHLAHEVNVLELEKTISQKTQRRFEDQMRKAMLREKKKTIEAELGEEVGDMESEEVANYKKKIKEAKMPKVVRARANKELKRLIQLSIHNPEGGYIRNYLDC